jgi:DNA-binding transcriptional regulator YiaG
VRAADLKAWREQQSLSQEDLAELLGVHWMTVSRWEVVKHEIPPFLHLALETLSARARKRSKRGANNPRPRSK